MSFRLRRFAKTGSASSVSLAMRESPAAELVRDWTYLRSGSPQTGRTTGTANLRLDGHVLINEESFDSWPSGALTAGTSYGSAGWATNPTGAQSGVASPFFPDGKAIQVTTAGYGGVRRAATLPSSGWRVQFFYHASATPTAAAYFARFRIAGTSQMLLRTAAANGIITVRNSAFTNPTSAQSRYQVTAGSKVRVEVQWDPNVGFWVYLYYGDNLFTQEPSETLYHPIEFTPGWAGLAPFDMIELGNDAAGEGYTATFDQVRVLSGAAPAVGPTTLSVQAGLSAAVQTVETGRSQNFNTGTGNVTVGNSGGSNGSAFSFVSPGTGTFTYDATQSAHGGQSLAMSAPNGTYQVVGWSGLNGASAAVSVYMRLATALPTATVDWLRLYGGSGGSTSAIASVYLNSSGGLLLLDGYDNVLHTTPNVLAINTWYRVEIFVDGRAGESARQRLAVYVGDSVNPIASFDSGFTVPWRRTLIDDVRLGRVSGSAATWAVNFDSLQVATGVPGFLGPWQSSAAGLSATAGLSADATVTGSGVTHNATAALSATAGVVSESLFANSSIGLADATVVTTGNSGGLSGYAWQQVVNTSTVKTTANAATAYDRGLEIATTAQSGAYVGWAPASGMTTGFFRVYVRLPSMPGATLRPFRATTTAGTVQWEVRISTAGQVIMGRQDGASLIQTATGVITTNTVYRIEASVVGTTPDLRIFVGEDESSPIGITNLNPYNSGAWDRVRFGAEFSSAQTYTIQSAAQAYSLLDWIGPQTGGNTSAALAATAGLTADGNVTTGGTTHTASASLSATAGVVTSGTVVDSGTAVLSATAGLAASGTVVDSGSASLSATAGLVVAGTVVDSATASAAAVAGLTVDGYVTRAGSAALSAAAASTASGTVVDSTTGTLSVSAGLVADGYVVRAASASLAAVAALSSAAGGQTLSATASLTAAAGLSASGVVVDSGTAVLAAAATMSVSGAITDIASATLSATAGLTATGSVTRSSTAALAGTAGMVATGLVTDTADASLSATAGLSASGSVTRVGSAALSATAALAVSAGGTQSATAALAGNAGLTASASVVRPTSSTIGAVGSLAASGFVTRFGSSSLSASAGLAATSSASLSGGGSTSVTASVTATATVTRSGSVTVSATATLVSQGSVSQAGQSSTSVSASIVATASVTATTSASLSGSAGMAVEGSVVVSRIHVWNGTQYKVSTGMYYKTATGWKPIPPSSTYYKTAAGWQSLG